MRQNTKTDSSTLLQIILLQNGVFPKEAV